MFICGYHFPASEGNDVAFEKVVEKIDANVGDVSAKKVLLKPEDRDSNPLEDIVIEPGTFMHKAFVDYYANSDIEGEYKMIFYTNKYQISEISKKYDGDATKDLCKKLDDMNLYRVKVS
ncbi:MAG: hypothetical protein ACQESH_09195 [Campylobacterota bacterium]